MFCEKYNCTGAENLNGSIIRNILVNSATSLYSWNTPSLRRETVVVRNKAFRLVRRSTRALALHTLSEGVAVSILKFAVALGLVLPAFAGRIVFTFSPTNTDSSLTLSGVAGSSATGNSGVLSVLNEQTLSVFSITGGTFAFTTGGRTSTPGTGTATLTPGGAWSISGVVTSGAQTATGVLASGTFLNDTTVFNLLGRNTLTSGVDVDFVNPIFMTILGISGYVDSTDRVSLSRPGSFNTTTGAYSNTGGSGTTNGTLAFDGIQAASGVPEPSTISMLGLTLVGTVGLLTHRRRSK